MATYTPPPPPSPALENPLDPSRVRNYEPYRARLADLYWTRSRPEYGNERQLVVDLELLAPRGASLGNARTWLSPRFGLNVKTGQVSKMTAFFNALAGQPETTVVAWFNDDEGDENGEHPMSWGYDETRTPYLSLKPGQEVTVRGKVVPRANEEGLKYSVQVFEPASASQEPTATTQPTSIERKLATAAAPAAPRQAADDGIPF